MVYWPFPIFIANVVKLRTTKLKYQIQIWRLFCSLNMVIGCIQDTLTSRAIGLAAVQPLGRERARAKVYCIQGYWLSTNENTAA